MQSHFFTDDARRDNVRLHDVQQQNDGEDSEHAPQRRRRAKQHHRDRHEQAGDQPDERDEIEDEHDEPQNERERYAEDHEQDRGKRADDRRNERLPAQVCAQQGIYFAQNAREVIRGIHTRKKAPHRNAEEREIFQHVEADDRDEDHVHELPQHAGYACNERKQRAQHCFQSGLQPRRKLIHHERAYTLLRDIEAIEKTRQPAAVQPIGGVAHKRGKIMDKHTHLLEQRRRDEYAEQHKQAEYKKNDDQRRNPARHETLRVTHHGIEQEREHERDDERHKHPAHIVHAPPQRQRNSHPQDAARVLVAAKRIKDKNNERADDERMNDLADGVEQQKEREYPCDEQQYRGGFELA